MILLFHNFLHFAKLLNKKYGTHTESRILHLHKIFYSASAEYFCDRVAETGTLTRYITNGNNVALISSRRLGKTGLIEHCFHQKTYRKGILYFLD